jgi:hypothetical protein
MPFRGVLRAAAIAVPVLTASLALTPIAEARPAPSGPAARTARQAPLTAVEAKALSRHVTDKVIVVLKNQVGSLPDTAADAAAREGAVQSLQHAVLAELAETHATNVKSLSLIDAVTATVSSGEARRLAANPSVAEVVKDELIRGPAPAKVTSAAAGGATPLPNACAAKGKVQLDPEALENIHAATQTGAGDAAQSLGYTGAGVKVGYIADGVDIDNPDFIRADGQHVFVDYQDFSGTGTNAPTGGAEAYIDSSSVAAQGREVYNVAGYGLGLKTPCLIRVRGVAPGASLVGLNIFGSADFAYNSVSLEAINYAVTVDHVNVLNESFGSNAFPDTASLDLTKMADDAAVKAGVTVTVSAGDAGPTDTIGSPATDPNVISAGASTTYRIYAQTGVGGLITDPKIKGWIDNNISGLSSAGFDQTGSTVDVVAPGDLNWTLCTPDLKLYADCSNFAGKASPVNLQGGTSEAAPLVAGVAALVIQAYAKTHGGHHPSPAVVKTIIVSTAENIGAPAEQQGAGLVDAYQAVLAAASYPGATTAAKGRSVLDGATQLNAVALPGTSEQLPETLTNDGSAPVTVHLSSRTLSPYQTVSTGALSLSEAADYSKVVTFTVAPGQARLDAAVTLRGGPIGLSLIAPDGDLAEYNDPQGVGNYGDAQVADPAAGTWTALISTESTFKTVYAHFQAATATWSPFGTLSASSVTLAPGAAQSFTLTVATPAQPGDQAGSIILGSSATNPSFAAVTSIPVTLRAEVPPPTAPTTFTGTLTGGNGRDPATGQTAYYQFAVPAGLPVLNAQISTGDVENTFLAELIDPTTGEAVSTSINRLPATTPAGKSVLEPELGTELHVLDPAAGLWTLVIDFYDTVSGTAVTQPFTVTLDDSPAPASAPGLPDSPGTHLTAGTPVTVGVQVTNAGTAPEAYFADARLDTLVTEKLAAQTSSTLPLPDLAGKVPTYLVPSHTTSLTAAAASPAKLFFDFTSAFGDPDLISSVGKKATGTYSAPSITPGIWTITPFLVGPTGPKAYKSVHTTTSMTATTAAFDPAVSSPTGDLWRSSINAHATFTPYVVQPGQTVTIPVTITPEGTPGTTVSGTVYIDDSSSVPGAVTFNELTGPVAEGSDVASFPYSYTIG